jgi:hypothetical protein
MGKRLEGSPTDQVLGGLAPDLQRLTARVKEAQVMVERVEGLADPVEHVAQPGFALS